MVSTRNTQENDCVGKTSNEGTPRIPRTILMTVTL